MGGSDNRPWDNRGGMAKRRRGTIAGHGLLMRLVRTASRALEVGKRVKAAEFDKFIAITRLGHPTPTCQLVPSVRNTGHERLEKFCSGKGLPRVHAMVCRT